MKTESAAIGNVEVAVYRVPTDQAESDGTIEWDHTDVVVVHLHGGGRTGLGWSYASPASAELIERNLRAEVVGQSAFAIEGVWQKMSGALRNVGRPGAGFMAVSAIDTAMWDLKARLLNLSIPALAGTVRCEVDLYGSGGFTSYDEKRLAEQLGQWAADGFQFVKMKVGRNAKMDCERVRLAREAIGKNVELFVDANGGYSRKQALNMAERFAEECGVKWFEEPRPSDDLSGLKRLRDRAPAGMDIAAGEYGDTPGYFRRMLEAEAVDCLQADVTRCGGYTGFLKAAALCEAFHTPLSAHCAPQLHAQIGCAVPALRHIEYFHDHVRIERLLFDGILEPRDGKLAPDLARPGHGMVFKSQDAERFRIA